LNIPEFNLNGVETYARVYSMYDGDTMSVILPVFDNYFRFTLRLNGIDTCEMRSKIVQNKKRAIQARNQILQWLLPDKHISLEEPYTRKQIQTLLHERPILVWVKCYVFDKYGRVLADVYLDAEKATKSLSNMLIDEKLAYMYQGGTKLTEEEQTENYSSSFLSTK